MKSHHTAMSQTTKRKHSASFVQNSQNEVESASLGDVGIDEACPVIASTLDVATSTPVPVNTTGDPERKPVDAVVIEAVAVDDASMESVSMNTTTVEPIVENLTHDTTANNKDAKDVAVLGREQEMNTAIKALEKSMHTPLIQLFHAADCVVYLNELERWFASDGFTTLSPEKMEDIAACLSTLARLRRMAQAVE